MLLLLLLLLFEPFSILITSVSVCSSSIDQIRQAFGRIKSIVSFYYMANTKTSSLRKCALQKKNTSTRFHLHEFETRTRELQ
mmetsp:Transcript_12197/g.18385  ORF Transcript_12197/g.18385 Transcript_12197/m.18385 type:complete len:82 (-) Transcript_12197:467-712(-)